MKGVNIKILDATQNKSMLNAVIEVTSEDTLKGNVEIKVYNPSLDKKKGATIELRKMSGFEYVHVERVKSVITTLLDGFLAGESI